MELTLESVQAKTQKFERQIRWRNRLEWLAAAVVVLIFSWKAISQSSLLIRLGAVEIVLAAAYVSYRLFKDGRTRRSLDPSASTTDYLKAHRAELLRQADLLRRAPIWYVGPFAIGLIAISAGAILEALAAGKSLVGALIPLGVILAVLVGVSFLNLRAARKLRRQADALDQDGAS